MNSEIYTLFNKRGLTTFALLLFFLTFSQIGYSQPDTIKYTGNPGFCPGGSITLTADPAPAGATYQWLLNGGSPSSASSYTVSTAGLVTLFVNGIQYQSLVISAFTKPTPDFIIVNNNGCSGTPIQFNSSVLNGTAPYSYSWNFGDGTPVSTAQNPAHTFTSLGCNTMPFFVTLTVTDANGCSNTTPLKQVNIKQAPDVQIKDQNNIFNPFNNCGNSPTPANPNYTITVLNNSLSLNCITKYSIDWGDGTNQDSISFPISHTYTQLGAFNLVITGTGANGCSNSKTYIVANQSDPGATFGTIPNTTTNLCAPVPVPLLISNWATNSQGTIYVIRFGDGDTLRLTHPLKPNAITADTIYHTYRTSSCPNSAFVVTLDVINACRTRPYTAEIPVQIKPSASFNTNTVGCVGQSHCFTNTTMAGYIYIGATCSSLTAYTWDFGDGTPTSPAINPCHTYASAGTYTVMLLANNPCGTDTFSKIICVRSTPVANFTMDKHTGCAIDTVRIINTSPTGICLGDSYKWTIAYQDVQSCGGSSGYSFITSTSDTSRNAIIRFTLPGRYIISLAETAIGSNCVSAVFRDTFYVKAKPKITIPSIAQICTGSTITPNATVNYCYSNGPTVPPHWTFTGGLPSSSDTIPPGPIRYDAAGTYPIKLAAQNECGITTDSISILVKQRPAFTNSSPKADYDTICSGSRDTIRLSAMPAGTNFSWQYTVNPGSVTGPAPGNNQNVSVINYVYTNTGTVNATVHYKIWAVSNGCTSDTVPVNITILTGATAANAGSNQVLCNATSAILSGNTPTVGNGTWSQVSGPTMANFTNTTLSSSSVTNLQPGIYVFKWSITSASGGVCGNSSANVTITNRPPVDSNIISSQNNVICSGQSVLINGTIPKGGDGTYTYQWESSTNNITFSLIGQTSASITVLPTVTTYYYRKVTSGPCVHNSDTIMVTVNPGITSNTIGSNRSICINTTPPLLTGSVPAGGGSTFSYSWDSSYNGTMWNLITVATGQDFQPGPLTVTTQFRRRVNTAACFGTQASISNIITITVNPDARAVFTPTRTVSCTPFPITADTINLTPFPNADSGYRWYKNDTLIGYGQTFPAGITMNNPNDSITIKLVAISRYGCKNDSMQRGFKTYPRPAPAFTQSDSVGCGPIKIKFLNNTPDITNYNYWWNFGNGDTSLLAQPDSVTFQPNPNSGDTVYTIRFVTRSQCSNDTLKCYVRIKSKPQALFTPDISNGCSTYNFAFSNTSHGIGNTYVWNYGDGSPMDTTQAAQVHHIYHVGNIDTFLVKLKATNECGTDSLIYNLVVQPITIHLDFAINGTDRFGCVPHQVTFYNNSQGGTNFSWDFGDGSPPLPRNQNIDMVPHTYTSTGTFTVILHGKNGCSDTTETKIVTVYPKPGVGFTANPLTACFGDTIHFNNTSDTGLVWKWRFGDGDTSIIQNPNHIYATGNTFRARLTGTKTYTSGVSCSDTAFKDIIIRDTLAGSFTAGPLPAYCTPDTIRFINANRPAAYTNWSFGDGSPVASGDSVAHIYMTPGIYIVKMISHGLAGCTYTSTQTIIIGGLSGTLLYNSGYLCPNIPLHMEIITNNTAQIKYVFGNGDSAISNSTTYNYSYPQPGIYIPYAEMMSGACKIRLTRGDTVKVDRLRTGFRTQQQQNCGITTVSFTDTSTAYFGIRTRSWNFGDGSMPSALQNPVHTYSQSGTYNVRLRITGNSNCVDTITIPVTVAVRNYPVSTISGDTLACIGQSLTLSAIVQSADPVAGYDWSFGNGNFGTGQAINAIYNIAGIYTVRLISRTDFGCTDTVYKTVRVNASPGVSAGPDPYPICNGGSTQLSATGTGVTNWQWSPLQGLSCTTCFNPMANPLFTTTYVVTGSNGTLCRGTDTITVTVIQRSKILVPVVSARICIPTETSVQLFANGTNTYAWSPANTLDNPNIPNPIASPTTTTVYQVVGKDAYNCFADTNYVRVNVGRDPVVNLGIDRKVIAGDTVILNPTIMNGPAIQYAWTPTNGLNFSNIPRPVATIYKEISYVVQVTNLLGCIGSDTIKIFVDCNKEKQLYVSNAFSPDGDGKNDVFMIRGTGIEGIKYLRIFNRFGQTVFERYNISANVSQQGWDGTINGIPAQPDVYIVTAEIICTGGGTFSYQGNLTLLRF